MTYSLKSSFNLVCLPAMILILKKNPFPKREAFYVDLISENVEYSKTANLLFFLFLPEIKWWVKSFNLLWSAITLIWCKRRSRDV